MPNPINFGHTLLRCSNNNNQLTKGLSCTSNYPYWITGGCSVGG